MRIGAAAVVTAVTGLTCYLTGAVPGVLACVFVLAYLGSLTAAPTVRCRSCQGRGDHPDPLGFRGDRACWTCHGRKKYPRAGVRLLRPETYRKIQAGEHGRNY
jgi:hypothetical protein